ncbi:hypothetical protein GCM10027570_44680 [Streptomonospora sediminis]
MAANRQTVATVVQRDTGLDMGTRSPSQVISHTQEPGAGEHYRGRTSQKLVETASVRQRRGDEMETGRCLNRAQRRRTTPNEGL